MKENNFLNIFVNLWFVPFFYMGMATFTTWYWGLAISAAYIIFLLIINKVFHERIAERIANENAEIARQIANKYNIPERIAIDLVDKAYTYLNYATIGDKPDYVNMSDGTCFNAKNGNIAVVSSYRYGRQEYREHEETAQQYEHYDAFLTCYKIVYDRESRRLR